MAQCQYLPPPVVIAVVSVNDAEPHGCKYKVPVPEPRPVCHWSAVEPCCYQMERKEYFQFELSFATKWLMMNPLLVVVHFQFQNVIY